MRHPRFVASLSAIVALASTGLAAGQATNDCASAPALKGYGTFPFDTNGATTDGAADVLCNFFSNQNIYNDV